MKISRSSVVVVLLVLVQGCAFIPRDTLLIDGHQRVQPLRDGDAWVFANGRFIGEIRDSQPDGPGTFITADGTRIEATYLKGIATAGKVIDNKDKLVYEGAFINGYWPIRANIKMPDERFSGHVYGLSFAKGELTTDRGQKFTMEAPLLRGLPDGLATLTDSAGNKQEVPYEKGIRNGTGRYVPVKGVTTIEYWKNGKPIYSHPDPVMMAAASDRRCATDWGEWYLASGRCPVNTAAGKATLYALDGQSRFIGARLKDGRLSGEYYGHAQRQRIDSAYLNGKSDGRVTVHVNDQMLYQGTAIDGRYDGIGRCGYEGKIERCQHANGVRNDPTHLYRLELAEARKQQQAAYDRERRESEARRRAEEEQEEREERRRRQREDEEGARIIGAAIVGAGASVGQAYRDIGDSRDRFNAEQQERQEAVARQQRYDQEQAQIRRDQERREQTAQSNIQHSQQLAALERQQREWQGKSAAKIEAEQRAYNQAQAARNSARPSSALLDTPTSAPAAASAATKEAKRYPAVPEAVAVCVSAGKAEHFRCYNTLSTSPSAVHPKESSGWRTPEEWLGHISNCKSNSGRRSLNDGGMYWLCGYGVSGIVQDTASAAGVQISGRGTFYCDASESYCKRRTPTGK